MIREVVNYETKHLQQIVDNLRNLERVQLDKIRTDLEKNNINNYIYK